MLILLRYENITNQHADQHEVLLPFLAKSVTKLHVDQRIDLSNFSVSDLQFPMVASAIVPNYSMNTRSSVSLSIDVPEIPATATLYLERDVLVDIFSGNITHWNDSRIQASNPSIADLLPYKPITRILRSVLPRPVIHSS